MKKFWEKLCIFALIVAAGAWALIEFLIPMLYEKRRAEVARRMETVKTKVEENHAAKKAEAEVAKAEVTKAAEEEKQGDMVALANDLIAGKK